MNAGTQHRSFLKMGQRTPWLKVAALFKNTPRLAIGLIGLLTTANVAVAQDCKFAILGDSLTAGYGVESAYSFPAQLANRLNSESIDCAVIDAGVSGDTTAGGASRINWVLADNPTHLMIELGGNDALRALPVAQMRDNLTKIIETAQAANVEVMLAGMLAPPNLGQTYGKAFSDTFVHLAQQYDLAFYPFFLEGVAGDPGLLIEDGLHPNADGTALIVDNIFPDIQAFLSSR